MARMRIDRLLVERGLFDSRAKAQAAIAAGQVRVAGAVVTKAAGEVDEGADITATAAHAWVGRGALKLAHALDLWPIRLAGKTVLDVGASTGGFTEVCLKAGAARVYAVDVGRGQLHPRIAADPRVVELSGVDARTLDRNIIPEPPDAIVCDVSFIGLEKALPAALDLAAPGAVLITLVKPQFQQLGPKAVGKGGIVRDEALRLQAVADVRDFLDAAGWTVKASADSPIAGGDGNLEYLVWAERS